MSDEHSSGNEPEKEPIADKDTHSNIAHAWEAITRTEVVTGSLRQIIDGSLLGTCIVFLATMLGVQHLDTPLTIALLAFVVAIPPLVLGFLSAPYKVKAEDADWQRLGFELHILTAFIQSSWIIEGFGGLAATAGVFAVLWHLSLLATRAFVSSVIIVIIISFILTIAILFRYAFAERKKQAATIVSTQHQDAQENPPQQQ